MTGTTLDTIMFKHQVLNLAVRSRVITGGRGMARGGELVRLWWGSTRVRNTDSEL